MNTSVDSPSQRAIDVRIGEEMFHVVLADGREIGVPYGWFWRLEEATHEERLGWRLIGTGQGIHWEAVDEDVSVEGILRGVQGGPKGHPVAGRMSV